MEYHLDSGQMPPYFKYVQVLQKGKPAHDKHDSFSIRHPSMDLGRRAKIFNAFDALKGFREIIDDTGSKITAPEDFTLNPEKILSEDN